MSMFFIKKSIDALYFFRVSTNENKIYTVKDFYLAFKDLKGKLNLSLGQIAIKTGLSKSFLSDIINPRYALYQGTYKM
jgi:hypothetical protein